MNLEANLAKIQKNIEASCERGKRSPAEVTILPVSKGQSSGAVRAVADLGLILFGENKVQEARVKIPQCPSRLRWHMIGHLQSNKCRDAIHFFEMIESVDSIDLAGELNRCAEKSAKTVPILLEVNIAGEATKHGLRPDQVVESLLQINSLRRLEIHGLMTIAPWTQDPEKVRPIFRKLRELRDQCSQALGAPLQHLSMGMSGDYQVAVEEGATIVRIGTALFGPRSFAKREASE